MAFKIVTITLAVLVICSAVYATEDNEAEQVKASIEEQIKKSDITCENVEAKCQELGEKEISINVCLILTKSYLCENRQSLDDVKESTIKVHDYLAKKIGAEVQSNTD